MTNAAGYTVRLRPDVQIKQEQSTFQIESMQGLRFLEVQFDAPLVSAMPGFFSDLSVGSFPGSTEQYKELMHALDDQGMLEFDRAVSGGNTGTGAFLQLRAFAEGCRDRVRSPLVEIMRNQSVKKQHLVGYAIEYWHVTHMCPRALAPVLAREDLPDGVWEMFMKFYQQERNHDKMLEKALKSIGIERGTLKKTQPLPSTAAAMAALTRYAYDSPLALFATLFPMEDPEPEFLDLLAQSCSRLGMPGQFYGPLADHSGINDDEDHGAISLELMSKFSFVSDEELVELKKAVSDVIEQRARIDTEIVTWYSDGGLRNWHGECEYPAAVGRKMVEDCELWRV